MGIKVRGTLKNLNRALSEATYQPDPHWNTHYKVMDAVEIELHDLDVSGLYGSGPHYKVMTTMYIQVFADNDKPFIHVPGDHRTYDYDGNFKVDKVDVIHCNEDELILIEDIKIDDIDASEQPGALMEVELSSTNGTFSLQSVTGLTILHGERNNNHVFRAKGTLLNINKALDKMSYIGNKDFNGKDVLVIMVNDLGNTGTGNYLVDVREIPLLLHPVNDYPVWHIPAGTLGVYEDSSVVVNGILIVDVDDTDENLDLFDIAPILMKTVVLKTSHGVVSLTRVIDVSFEIGSGIQDRHMRFTGSTMNINRALEALVYYPDPDFTTGLLKQERDAIQLRVDDNGLRIQGGNGTAIIEVPIQRVTGFNDPPVVTVPGATIVKMPCEDEPATKRHAAIERQCDRIVGVAMISIPEDTPYPIFGIKVDDVDAANTFGGVIEVSISCHHCMISLSSTIGIRFLEGTTGMKDSLSVKFRGDLENVNAALDGITYQGNPDYYGRDNFTVFANDLGNSGRGGPLEDYQVIPLNITAVNDAPAWQTPDLNCSSGVGASCTIVKNFTGYFVDEDETLEIPLRVVDVDAANGEMEVTITSASGMVSISSSSSTERLTFIGLTVVEGLQKNDSVDARQMRFSGKLFDINQAIAGLRYTGLQDYHSNGNDSDNVTIVVYDRNSIGNGGAQFARHILHIYVREVNDAPVVTRPTGKLFVDEDKQLMIEGVSIFDVDADDSYDILEVTVSVLHGTLSVSAFYDGDFLANESKPMNPSLKEAGDDLLNLYFTRGDGVNDERMTFQGTVKALNDALKHLSYTGMKDFNGEDTITVQANDLGQFGSYNTKRPELHSVDVSVEVIAVNDKPIITVPMQNSHNKIYRIYEDSEFRITGVRYYGKPIVPSRTVYQSGYELFRSEGRRPDADWPNWRGRLVADMWPGRKASSPRYFQVYKNALYFSADDGVHGRELWRTSHDVLQQDQYATELVKDIFPGSRGSDPTWIITMGNTLYFASNGVDTTWMNFDDACGGFRHSSLNASVAYAVSESNVWNPDYVYDCPSGYHWADTEEGLAMVETGNQGSHPGGTTHLRGKTSYYNQCGWNGYYFGGKKRRLFRFSDSHITGAYKSAGTQEDAELIVTNFETSEFAGIVCVRGLDDEDNDNSRCRKQEVKDTARMPGLPVRPCYIRGGNELWRTDSTENGTYRLADIRAGVGSSNPEFLVAHEPSGTLFFAATKDPQGRELFVSDGTQEGTQLVEDIYYGAGGSNPKHITIRNETDSTPLVFFQARDKQRGEV